MTAPQLDLPAWPRRPSLFDAALGIGLAGFCCAVASGLSEAKDRTPDTLMYVLIVACALPMVFRRVQPLGSLAVSVGALAAYIALGYPGGPVFAVPLIAVFCVGLQVRRPTLPVILGTAGIVFLVASFIGVPADQAWQVVAYVPLWMLGASFVAMAGRNRRQQMVDAAARVAEAEANQQASAQRQVAEERLRIARDIHDVVGHSLASIAVLAGAGSRVIDSDPESAKRALDDIRRASAGALNEVRATIGGLRAGSAPVVAASSGDFGALVESLGAAGLRVEADIALDPRQLDEEQRTTLYRIAQESLTNVLRHSGTNCAELLIEPVPDGIRLTVTDHGRGVDGSTSDEPAGHGLTGMRERAARLGGRLVTANRIDGGFEVRAWLPTDPLSRSSV